MNNLKLPPEADTRLAREDSPDRRNREVREKEFLDECKAIIDPICEDFNMAYGVEFGQDQFRFLEIRFANGEQRASTRISYSSLVEAEKPYLMVRQEVSALISHLTYHIRCLRLEKP